MAITSFYNLQLNLVLFLFQFIARSTRWITIFCLHSSELDRTGQIVATSELVRFLRSSLTATESGDLEFFKLIKFANQSIKLNIISWIFSRETQFQVVNFHNLKHDWSEPSRDFFHHNRLYDSNLSSAVTCTETKIVLMNAEHKFTLIKLVTIGMSFGSFIYVSHTLLRTVSKWRILRRSSSLIDSLIAKLKDPLASTCVVSTHTEWENVYQQLAKCV